MQYFSNRILKWERVGHDYFYPVAFALIGLIYFFNLFIDIMDVDAAQYASISWEMLQKKSFLEVYHQNKDYLDKPPLLFWLSSLSFSILGVSNFAYKLPSVLILVLGIYSTFRFTLMHYDIRKAKLAALIFASSQALLLISNDVRTDCSLVGLVIFAVWQLSEYIHGKSYVNLFLASLGIGGAMLAKGPIGFVLPFLGIGPAMLLAKNWKAIFRPQWLLLILVVGLIILPMCIGLYRQFDLHPEKSAYGIQSPSGLKFYFWTQSFGRITGDSAWKDDSNPLFFIQSILWDFQPWTIIFFIALFCVLFKPSFRAPENISIISFLLGFFAFSFSQYKLPHYIFPLLPFAAVITAHFLIEASEKWEWFRSLYRFQVFLSSLFFVIILISYFLFFAPSNGLIIGFFIITLGLYLYVVLMSKQSHLRKLVMVTIVSFIMFGMHTSTYFYPNLLTYQCGKKVGQFFINQNVPVDMSYYYGVHMHSMEYYGQRIMKDLPKNELQSLPTGAYIFTDEKGMAEIRQILPNVETIESFDHYKVTRLNLKFLSKSTRPYVLQKHFIVRVN